VINGHYKEIDVGLPMKDPLKDPQVKREMPKPEVNRHERSVQRETEAITCGETDIGF
jgi:hypothetical protein